MNAKTVLLVDDDANLTENLEDILRDEGYLPFSANTCAQALELASECKPQAALLDLKLPDGSGTRLLAELKRLFPDCICTLMTGYADLDSALEALQEGAFHYLQKPVKPAEVLKVFERVSEVIRLREERRTSEEKLRESGARYRAVVEDQAEMICRFLPDGTLTFVNGSYCRYFKKPAEELVGHKFFSLIPEEDREKVNEHLASLCSGNPVATHQHRVTIPTGQTRWHQWTNRAIFDEHNRLAEFQGVGRDITERKRGEEALRASEERYRVLSENVGDGVAVVQSRALVFANNMLCSMLEYPADQLLGLDPMRLFQDDRDKTRFRELLKQAEQGKDVPSFQGLCVAGDGCELWMDIKQSSIQWEGDSAVLMTVRDVTISKLREIALEDEKEQLRKENRRLRTTIKDRYKFGNIIGKSSAMQEVYEGILQAAATDANVIVYGESGTGKELVARAIHDASDRNDKSFVPVNCAAIPENLLESEFFGHRKGAFTGAVTDKHGYLDLANGGTLLLDEVGDFSLNMQVKLLRAIETRSYFPVGGIRPTESDFRIIAATNRDLKDLLGKGLLREDFFYRIHVIPITLVPLRERKEDIPLLVEHFLQSKRNGLERPRIPAEVMHTLCGHDWPGNVRELQNVLQRYIATKRLDFMGAPKSAAVESKSVAADEMSSVGSDLRTALKRFEKQLIFGALKQNSWNRSKVSSLLGVPRRTLYRKMREFGLY